MKYCLGIVLIGLASSLGACSTSNTTPLASSSIESVELFMSRTHLSDTDFEHFKLEGEQLFVECGAIRRGRFMPHDQNMLKLTAEKSAEIQRRCAAALSAAVDQKLDTPGDNGWLADPGQFSLEIKSATDRNNFRTSLDSVSSPSTPAEHRLRELASEIRSTAGGALCDNRSFFGLQ